MVTSGCVGFCYGGAVSNMLAVRIPDLAAAVPFYGGQPATEDVPKIKAPLLLHYASNDERVNAGWPAYETALKANGVRYTAHFYEGTAARFSQRYDAAVRRSGSEARVGANSRVLQAEYVLKPAGSATSRISRSAEQSSKP